MLNVMFFQLRYNAITRSQNKNFWPFKWPYNISVVFYINYIYIISTYICRYVKSIMKYI